MRRALAALAGMGVAFGFAASVSALPGDAEAIAKASILDQNPEDAAAVAKVCTRCHGAALFLNAPRSSSRWEQTYAQMTRNGARGSIDELNGVVHYMQKNLTIINANTSPPDELGPTLQVSDAVVDAIILRRAQTPFSGVADLASIPGVDRNVLETLNSRHLLLF